MVKIPDPRFKRYRLRLREEGGSLLGPSQWKENEPFLGKPVQLYEFTYYEPEEFGRSRLGRWLIWKFWGNDKRLEIWGQQVRDDTWAPISPWLLKEQRATEHLVRQSLPRDGQVPEGKLKDPTHAPCVNALIARLVRDGHNPGTEGNYNWFGQRGRVDVYYFDKSAGTDVPTRCAVYEVWTQIDNLNEVLGKLDEKADAFPKYYAGEHKLGRPLTASAHLVVLATRGNMDIIRSYRETFEAKFPQGPAQSTQFHLEVFDPVAGELETLLPTRAGTNLDDQTLSRWARYSSKSVFLQAWQKKFAR